MEEVRCWWVEPVPDIGVAEMVAEVGEVGQTEKMGIVARKDRCQMTNIRQPELEK